MNSNSIQIHIHQKITRNSKCIFSRAHGVLKAPKAHLWSLKGHSWGLRGISLRIPHEFFDLKAKSCSKFSLSVFPRWERQTLPKNSHLKFQHKNPAPHHDSIESANQVVLQTQPMCLCEYRKSKEDLEKQILPSTRSSAPLFPPYDNVP